MRNSVFQTKHSPNHYNTMLQSKYDPNENLKDKYIDKDVIYYNLTLNKGYQQKGELGFTTPASFSEINQVPILFNAGEWFTSIMRCTIPTSVIPRMIFPIQASATQDDYNLGINTFTFRYSTAPGVYLDPVSLLNYQNSVKFQTEFLYPYPLNVSPDFSVPKSPEGNGGNQDTVGVYYFVYYVESILKMFNDTMSQLWNGYTYTPPVTPNNPTPVTIIVPGFRSAMNTDHGLGFPADIQPFFTYNDDSQLFSINAESTFFNLATYPRVEIFSDSLTEEQLVIPYHYNCRPSVPPIRPFDIAQFQIYDLRNNSFPYTINTNPYIFFKIEADKPGPVVWAAFQKIIFEVTGDIQLKHNETDSIPLNFDQSTIPSFQKPLISILTDLEVDRTAFSRESFFIQYQQSSIEEVRLLNLSERSVIQNFNLNISWIDNFGNRRLLDLPSIGNPLTVKLAFFRKDFRN